VEKGSPWQYRRARTQDNGEAIVPLTIEVEQEADGRWLAEVVELPGVLTYGQTRQEAIDRVKALSLRVLADRLDHGEPVPQMGGVFAVTP
jgi:predicted RNase H-like HicB family nuclease